MNAVPHGTRAGYSGTSKRQGCRCEQCREANRAYLAERVRVATHGVRSTYTMGCRCDQCREAQRLYHLANRDRPSYRRAQREAKAHIETLKDAPCMDCGGRFPPECMDFDHVRGEKLFNVSHVAKALKNIEKLEAEIAKCDLVCANCHRIRTKARHLEVSWTR